MSLVVLLQRNLRSKALTKTTMAQLDSQDDVIVRDAEVGDAKGGGAEFAGAEIGGDRDAEKDGCEVAVNDTNDLPRDYNDLVTNARSYSSLTYMRVGNQLIERETRLGQRRQSKALISHKDQKDQKKDKDR